MAYVTNFSLEQTERPRPQYVDNYGYDTRTILCSHVGNVAFYATRMKYVDHSAYTLYYIGRDNLNISYQYTEYLKGKPQNKATKTCRISEWTEGGYPVTKVDFSVGLYSGLVKTGGGYLLDESLFLNVPKFEYKDTASIVNYIKTGDTSGAIVDVSTDWNIYIDGTNNPLYKLTWNCADISSSDLSKVKVMLCGYDETVNAYIVKDTQYYEYNQKSVKLNYHDIYETVWGNLGGLTKSPIAIIVQFEYYDTTTVLPKSSSSSMYCELYPTVKDGHMYGSIGFCEKGTQPTWFVKTDSGDSSTFKAHDGTDGSDGYTKDDDKGYDDNKDKDDTDSDTAVLSSGIGVLTSTFHMTKERLVQLGQFLWSGSIFDQFSLINNNPIENIISCKAIPFVISGTNQEIVLGNVSTGVNGEKISQNFSKQTIGTVDIKEHYKNFLDYAPYTNVIIYLPYIGFKELDTSLVMGKTLKIEYTLDVITGGCLAQIYVGNIRLYEFTGNIGIDISITASNRAQVEGAYINAGVGVVSSAMSGNVTGAVNSIIGAATSQYHYSGTGNPSPSCVASTNRTCYVIIDRPQYQPLKAFNHTRGRMCCLSKTIGSLKGYTVCDGNIDISGISATDEEKDEIVNILSTGFFA